MSEIPELANPAGLVADPRFRNLLLTLTYRDSQDHLKSAEITASVPEGEGQVWYEPGFLPVAGHVGTGTMVIASPCFPRRAPLTLRWTGSDICLKVRGGQVACFAFTDGLQSLARFICSSFLTAGSETSVEAPDPSEVPANAPYRFRIHHESRMDDRSNRLAVRLLKGELSRLLCPETEGKRVFYDRIRMERAEDGELVLQLESARLELDFRDGCWTALRIASSDGPIASLKILEAAEAGVSIRASFLDTLP